MTRKEQRREGKGAIELIEEAVHLLRLAPGGVLAAYYLGTLPFALGFLYFWADMAHSAFGHQRCAPAALGMALLFVWMKTWQAVFARQLRAQATAEPLPPVSLRRLLRVAVVQAALQPSGFLVLPLALIAALPFGWAYAYYQNVTACGGELDAGRKAGHRQAVRQSRLWPKQNHLLLSILALFGLVVFFNVVVGMIQVPFLLKTFLGIETQFTRSLWSVLNTTFFATCCAVTYLCLDPLIKAAYALRCFYGESLQTGEDLKVELRRLAPAPAT